MVVPFAAAMDTAPFAYVRGAEKVVVAVHVGMPLRYARTLPAVPAVVVARALAPLPFGIAPAEMLAQPVPPYGTPIVEAFQMPEVRVPTVARFPSVVRWGAVVVANQLVRESFASSADWRSV